jgi:hypothetical protein
MVQGFAKNLLARRWIDVIGFDITASDAHAAALVALGVASYPKGHRWTRCQVVLLN